ncbi:MAG: purine-nucleoside phosphorylase [Bacteroidetes bacterium]|nr:purine-nucleoside phosphorylase [Bacteroidota bacterium]
MSIHINAKIGEIASTVLMPGDPLRAQFIAENYLTNAIKVSQTRNVLFYTGIYNNTRVTVGASGMGCPSIGIYSYELFTEFNVDNIIRIGTCGSYTTDLRLYELINVKGAVSESTFAKNAWGFEEELQECQGTVFESINKVAAQSGTPLQIGNTHSSDVFYSKNLGTPLLAAKYDCRAVEMESFALFANARYLAKNAACLLTVTDIIPTHERLSATEREQALHPMMKLALDTACSL